MKRSYHSIFHGGKELKRLKKGTPHFKGKNWAATKIQRAYLNHYYAPTKGRLHSYRNPPHIRTVGGKGYRKAAAMNRIHNIIRGRGYGR